MLNVEQSSGEMAVTATLEETPWTAATRMLETAAATADRLVHEALSEAESIVTAARARADEITSTSRREAERVAAERARDREEQAARLDAALVGLAEERAALEVQIATLRASETDQRNRMRDHLTQHLALLDEVPQESPATLTG